MCRYEWSPRSSTRFESARHPRPTLSTLRLCSNRQWSGTRAERETREPTLLDNGRPAWSTLSFFSSRLPVTVTLMADTDVVLQRKEVPTLELENNAKEKVKERETQSRIMRCIYERWVHYQDDHISMRLRKASLSSRQNGLCSSTIFYNILHFLLERMHFIEFRDTCILCKNVS